jgi:hypothetical protein
MEVTQISAGTKIKKNNQANYYYMINLNTSPSLPYFPITQPMQNVQAFLKCAIYP